MGKDENHICVAESFFSSRQLYLNLFENAVEAIFFLSGLKVVDCNISARNLFGFSNKSDILGRNLFDFSPDFQNDGQKSVLKIKEIISSPISKFNLKFNTTCDTTFEAQVIGNSFTHQNCNYLQLTVHELPPHESTEKKNRTHRKYPEYHHRNHPSALIHKKRPVSLHQLQPGILRLFWKDQK